MLLSNKKLSTQDPFPVTSTICSLLMKTKNKLMKTFTFTLKNILGTAKVWLPLIELKEGGFCL